MTHRGLKLAAIAAFAAALITSALGAASANAAGVTASHITTPGKTSYLLDTGSTKITVSGTTKGGTTGDQVDINCYYGSGLFRQLAAAVPVNSKGSFSTTTALDPLDYHLCTLRAVPAGTTPSTLTPFAGPLVGVSHAEKDLNVNQPYDFYDWGQQSTGAFDYLSVGGCGIDDGYLYDSAHNLTTTTYYCDAYLYATNSAEGTRSELQVDGANAYPPEEAERINKSAAGLPTLKVSQKLDPKTGDLVINETDQIVKCSDSTFPPTALTCATFVGTGVTDHRTITQNSQGLVSWITDVFTSTDKKSHKLDLLWENDNHFATTGGNGLTLETEFPGEHSYAHRTVGDNIKLPRKPGTIKLRVQGSADGDTTTGRGAIVYDTPASNAIFTYDIADYNTFELHQTAKIPARGSVRFRFAYVQAYKQATVDKLAKNATTVFAGCTVPKVTGKTLTTAKKAITRAHCAVGKIRQAASSTIPSGVVVAENPAAGTHVDYGTKVDLIVSKG